MAKKKSTPSAKEMGHTKEEHAKMSKMMPSKKGKKNSHYARAMMMRGGY